MTKDDAKLEALKQSRTLNPHPERVREPHFAEEEFFDPRDLLQVKYEMVRRVQVEEGSVSGSARDFGFSRPSLYQALAAFEKRGLGGLIPQRRGPKKAHKLSQEIVSFLEQSLSREPTLRSGELAELLQRHFKLSVHPRSIERALARGQKKRLTKRAGQAAGGPSERKKS